MPSENVSLNFYHSSSSAHFLKLVMELFYEELFQSCSGIPSGSLERAQREINEKPECLQESLSQLRDLMKFDANILQHFGSKDNDHLLRYLRARKFNVEKSITLMKGNFTRLNNSRVSFWFGLVSFIVLRWRFCEYSRKNDTRTKWNVSLIYLISYDTDDNEWATGCAMIILPFYHSVIFVKCVMADPLNPRVITPWSVKREVIIFLGLILIVSLFNGISTFVGYLMPKIFS